MEEREALGVCLETRPFQACSAPLPENAFSKSSRSKVRICPNQFFPFHLLLSAARSSSFVIPMPQIVSYGLASTNVVPRVASNSSSSCLFCENLYLFASYTILRQLTAHSPLSNPFTCLPSSFELNPMPNALKSLLCHWEKGEEFFQKNVHIPVAYIITQSVVHGMPELVHLI